MYKKVNLNNLKRILSPKEMKNVTGGSKGCNPADSFCPNFTCFSTFGAGRCGISEISKKYILVIFSIFFISTSLTAQQVVAGRITDAEDGTPVQGAAIFIANTTIGTTSSESGNYSLTYQGAGSFEIVVSHVGYQPVFHKIETPKSFHQYDVALEIYELQEVAITVRSNYSRRDVDFFWERILGEKPSRRRMEVLNSEKVYFFRNSANVLRASCEVPIEIINHDMGYLIRYTLAAFQHDYQMNQTSFYGTPYFEELVPQNSRQKERWEIKRQEAYAVSLTHFMRSLYRKQIHEEGFLLLKKESVNSKTPPTPVLLKDILQDDQEEVLVNIDEPLLLVCYSKPVTDQMIQNSYADIFVSSGTSPIGVNIIMGASETFPVFELKPQQFMIYSDGTFKGSFRASERRGNLFGLSSMVPTEYVK